MIPPKETVYLCEPAFLNVIKVAGRTGNLALTTFVKVNTIDNSTIVNYEVRSWNNAHRRLDKKFTVYSDALNYYNKLIDKFEEK